MILVESKYEFDILRTTVKIFWGSDTLMCGQIQNHGSRNIGCFRSYRANRLVPIV
jgi:hypothetical protein